MCGTVKNLSRFMNCTLDRVNTKKALIKEAKRKILGFYIILYNNWILFNSQLTILPGN